MFHIGNRLAGSIRLYTAGAFIPPNYSHARRRCQSLRHADSGFSSLKNRRTTKNAGSKTYYDLFIKALCNASVKSNLYTASTLYSNYKFNILL